MVKRLPNPFLTGPVLDRPATLKFMGDWGGANIHAICGWLAMEFWDRAPFEAKTEIHNGRGAKDGIRALARRAVDVAIVTPSEFAEMARRGIGPFAGEPHPWLRALGRIPQDDRLVFAIDAALGLKSFADLRERTPSLKIATCPDDGENWIGWAAVEALRRSGIPPETFQGWGCEVVIAERPHDCARLVLEGRADAILHEGISGPWWPQLEAARPLAYIPFEPDVRAAAREELGWTSDPMPEGLFPVAPDFETLNFDDFTILVRDDLADDVVDVLAWCIIETRANLERKYLHLPSARSPICHPMQPREMIDTLVPLHDAAARRYRAMNLL